MVTEQIAQIEAAEKRKAQQITTVKQARAALREIGWVFEDCDAPFLDYRTWSASAHRGCLKTGPHTGLSVARRGKAAALAALIAVARAVQAAETLTQKKETEARR